METTNEKRLYGNIRGLFNDAFRFGAAFGSWLKGQFPYQQELAKMCFVEGSEIFQRELLKIIKEYGHLEIDEKQEGEDGH